MFCGSQIAWIQRGHDITENFLHWVLRHRRISQPQKQSRRVLSAGKRNNSRAWCDQSKISREPEELVAGNSEQRKWKGHNQSLICRSSWIGFWAVPGLMPSKSCPPLSCAMPTIQMDNFQFRNLQIPVLVVGTKIDLLDEKQKKTNRSAQFASSIGAEEISVDCRNPRCFHAGSTDAVKLSRFLDKVIERKYFSRDSSTFVDKRKFANNIMSPVDNSSRYVSPFASPLGNYSNFSSNLATLAPLNQADQWLFILNNVLCIIKGVLMRKKIPRSLW